MAQTPRTAATIDRPAEPPSPAAAAALQRPASKRAAKPAAERAAKRAVSGPKVLYTPKAAAAGRTIGRQLIEVLALMRREAETRMAALGLTEAQWRPLWVLQCGQAHCALELARRLDADPGATTRMLDRLEAKGLLQRVRSAQDRRVVELSLTESGRAAVASVPAVLAALNNDFLRGFAPEEWQQLGAWLERMKANGQDLVRARGQA